MLSSFNEICRLCMKSECSLFPIFEQSSELCSRIEMISSVVQMRIGDGLPQQICKICLQLVDQFWKFKLQCELSDTTLRLHLKQQLDVTETKEGDKMVEDCWECRSKKECDNRNVLSDCEQTNTQLGGNISILKNGLYQEKNEKLQEIESKHQTTEIPKIQERTTALCKADGRSTFNALCEEYIIRTENIEENKVKIENGDTSGIFEQDINDTLRWTEEHKQIMQRGTQNSQSVKYHKCKVCGNLVQRLNVHMRKHTGDKPYQCSQCGQCFTQVGSLKKHQTLHLDIRPHQCLVCGKCFRCKSDLSLHSKLHTGQSYDCALCGKQFVTQRAIDNHIRIHTGEKPFLCHLCGTSFSQEGNLSLHLKVHEGEKPFHCSVCGKEFTTRTHLNRHMTTHTGERPYGCATCGKYFRDRGYLMQHQTVHSGERSYCCSVCCKTFTQLISLKRHSRLHTGEKPFECEQCSESFVLKRDLKRHCEKVHTLHYATTQGC